MLRLGIKEYAKQDAGGEKGKSQVLARISMKTEADKVVNQVLAACWVIPLVIQNKKEMFP